MLITDTDKFRKVFQELRNSVIGLRGQLRDLAVMVENTAHTYPNTLKFHSVKQEGDLVCFRYELPNKWVMDRIREQYGSDQ